MGTTTISLRDEAYDRLRAAKREGESFSDVVLRLTDSPTTDEQIAALAGGLDADFADAVTESSEQVGASLEMESGETE
ncbi:antitoxin VapB family protein [Haloarcula salinisoli]|uniref:Antitoxin VapB family protein n=1 Tax=Haloarcula salinisoli TaxID=2487746 RepID=A0A8J7YDU5_9EURY|nr:antitoxin VapB family protein [Halomicroarcula salinisoli]MBX0286974.1 antitoxin VapB family protein [Halomicroarcula salinisoli]MBX0304275.1 antitoxin VapB family protein [Halomicroarcula salinisoli]